MIREAAALEPGRAVLWLAAGQFELELGLVEASRRSFGQALALQPESRAAEAGLRAAGGTGWLDRWFRRLRAFRGG